MQDVHAIVGHVVFLELASPPQVIACLSVVLCQGVETILHASAPLCLACRCYWQPAAADPPAAPGASGPPLPLTHNCGIAGGRAGACGRCSRRRQCSSNGSVGAAAPHQPTADRGVAGDTAAGAWTANLMCLCRCAQLTVLVAPPVLPQHLGQAYLLGYASLHAAAAAYGHVDT